MKIVEQYRYAKANGQLRPLWQIAILLPLFPIYKLAQGIVWVFEEMF